MPSVSTFEQYVNNLHDLARLPIMEQTIATQYTSRNWVALEHYFDWFVDDGNFTGSNYGYIAEDGKRYPYRIVQGYDGAREYEIVPRVEGPGMVTRIWFAHQQHQSYNNPKDMSREEEWANWGNLGEVGNIRFYLDDEMVPRVNIGIKDLFVGKASVPGTACRVLRVGEWWQHQLCADSVSKIHSHRHDRTSTHDANPSETIFDESGHTDCVLVHNESRG